MILRCKATVIFELIGKDLCSGKGIILDPEILDTNAEVNSHVLKISERNNCKLCKEKGIRSSCKFVRKSFQRDS